MDKSVQRAGSIAELRSLARKRVPRAVFDYIDGGADDEVTLRRNRRSFDRLCLVPRVLVDVSERDQSTTVLGQRVSSPLILSPVGLAGLAHPHGELAAARAAHRSGLGFALSSSSSWSLEEVAAGCPGHKWFQLYVWRDRRLTASLVERAQEAGYTALCLTVDVPVVGNRERDRRNGLTIPPRPSLRHVVDVLGNWRWFVRFLADEWFGHGLGFGNISTEQTGAQQAIVLADFVNQQFDPSVTWADLAWLRDLWDGSLVVKGVVDPADARRCVDAGVDGIAVSNHGGRQLDGMAASVDALTAVLAAVGSEVEVYLDGGVRRGSDIAKALALGAQACMVGRPYVYGLAAGGERGVEQAIEILRTELDRTLALLGRSSVADLDETAVSVSGRRHRADP